MRRWSREYDGNGERWKSEKKLAACHNGSPWMRRMTKRKICNLPHDDKQEERDAE